MSNQPARLLLDHLDLFTTVDPALPVLDLACGAGRNGMALARQGLPLVFADRSATSLDLVRQQLAASDLSARIWQVDLEQPGSNPLADLTCSALICFRYLHRPLFSSIRDIVMPGGLVVYQTFTVEQTHFGRPNNPDFLLKTGELKTEFRAWEQLHYFEGVLQGPSRAVAQIVARKP
jgi:tellurite methyltransferase